MHRKEQLSPTHEMYLKVLYRLGQEDRIGRVRDMALGLGVSAGTVSAVLKKLEAAGFVRHERYGQIRLTPAGSDVACCVVRRFETLRAFLGDVLGLAPEIAEVDACMMEHAVSPATVNRLERFVELVRDGRIRVDALTAEAIPLELATCADCEANGVCRAEAGGAPV